MSDLINYPPICTAHHFKTLDPCTDGQAFDGRYASACDICGATVVGTTLTIRAPDCARHQHWPKMPNAAS